MILIERIPWYRLAPEVHEARTVYQALSVDCEYNLDSENDTAMTGIEFQPFYQQHSPE